METGFRRPERNSENFGDLGHRKVEIEPEHDHQSLLHGKTIELAGEPVTLGQVNRWIDTTKTIRHIHVELDDVAPAARLGRATTGPHREAIQPSFPRRGVTERTDVSPGEDQGLLDRVLGALRITKDEPSGSVQSRSGLAYEDREGFVIPRPRPFDHLEIHGAPAAAGLIARLPGWRRDGSQFVPGRSGTFSGTNRGPARLMSFEAAAASRIHRGLSREEEHIMMTWLSNRASVAASRLLRRLALVVALAAVALGSAGTAQASEAIDPSTLIPPPPDPYTCRAIPSGQIRCDYNVVFDVEPFPTGLVCGEGADAFELWDGGESIRTIASRTYDDQGRILDRTVHETYLGASFVNVRTGASVRYTQSNTIHSEYAVPGDITSVTEATTGNAAIFVLAGGGAIMLNAGRTVWAFDPTIDDLGLISAAGPQAFVTAFVDGNFSVFQPICDALGG